MTNLESFNVDLANPSGISGKLPEAEEILQGLERELEEKREQVAHWQRSVAIMRALTDVASGDSEALANTALGLRLTELQALVVGVVNREVRKIQAKEVTAILKSEGFDISGDSVSNCLWHVAEKLEPRPIQRVGRGFYAPLAYKETELTAGGAAGSALAGIGAGAIIASILATK